MYGLLFNELSGGQSARYPFINIPTGIPSPTGSLRCFTIVFSLSLSFSPLFSYTEFLDCIQDGCYISLVCVFESEAIRPSFFLSCYYTVFLVRAISSCVVVLLLDFATLFL